MKNTDLHVKMPLRKCYSALLNIVIITIKGLFHGMGN